MKKLFFFLFLSNLLFAQEVTVKYKMHINRTNDYCSVIKNFTLQQNDDFSIFELDDIKDINQFKYKEMASVAKEKDTLVAYVINDNIIEFLYKEKFFKDFKDNTQTYNPLVGMKCQYVKDKIDLFEWEILSDNDTLIANYHCKKAVTKFRGREYVAYFTNKIANQGGPWKFDGLPGFILKVKSKDGYLLIEPIGIKLNQNKDKILNDPFGNKKTILFQDLKDKVLQEEKRYFAKLKSRPNPPDRTVAGPIVDIEDIGLNKERVYE